MPAVDAELVTEETISSFVNEFGCPRRGSGRLVFHQDGSGVVYKLAFTTAGLRENEDETRGTIHGVPIAPAHLETILGAEVLVMDYVHVLRDARTEILATERQRYDWVRSVDMWQVGVARDGQLVAYDGGRINPSHRKFQVWPD